MLSLEFTRYCSKTEKMTEEDFCRHMLYTSSLTSKKKEKMLARVSKRFKGKGPGICFTSFKNFYNVLFGGADLERAMFYLDTEGRGVNREEFAKIANWVCNQELDPHVVSWHLNIQHSIVTEPSSLTVINSPYSSGNF